MSLSTRESESRSYLKKSKSTKQVAKHEEREYPQVQKLSPREIEERERPYKKKIDMLNDALGVHAKTIKQLIADAAIALDKAGTVEPKKKIGTRLMADLWPWIDKGVLTAHYIDQSIDTKYKISGRGRKVGTIARTQLASDAVEAATLLIEMISGRKADIAENMPTEQLVKESQNYMLTTVVLMQEYKLEQMIIATKTLLPLLSDFLQKVSKEKEGRALKAEMDSR